MRWSNIAIALRSMAPKLLAEDPKHGSTVQSATTVTECGAVFGSAGLEG